jgi:hypothetical protein
MENSNCFADEELKAYFLTNEDKSNNLSSKSTTNLQDYKEGIIIGDEFVLNRMTSKDYSLLKKLANNVKMSEKEIMLQFVPDISPILFQMYADRFNSVNITVIFSNFLLL